MDRFDSAINSVISTNMISENVKSFEILRAFLRFEQEIVEYGFVFIYRWFQGF